MISLSVESLLFRFARWSVATETAPVATGLTLGRAVKVFAEWATGDLAALTEFEVGCNGDLITVYEELCGAAVESFSDTVNLLGVIAAAFWLFVFRCSFNLFVGERTTLEKADDWPLCKAGLAVCWFEAVGDLTGMLGLDEGTVRFVGERAMLEKANWPDCNVGLTTCCLGVDGDLIRFVGWSVGTARWVEEAVSRPARDWSLASSCFIFSLEAARSSSVKRNVLDYSFLTFIRIPWISYKLLFTICAIWSWFVFVSNKYSEKHISNYYIQDNNLLLLSS